MKKLAISVLLMLSFLSYGQEDSTYRDLEKKDLVYSVENMPQVEGGRDAFLEWIYDNNKLRDQSDTLTVDDVVFISFSVDTTGILTSVEVVKGLDPLYDKEAYRLVTECPLKWTPASQGGRNIVVPLTMPISFVSEGKK